MADFAESVASDDLRVSLGAVRDRLVAELAEAGPREVAPLTARLVDVLIRLAALPSEEKSGLDELKDRRSRRKSQVSKLPGQNVKRGAGGG